MATRGRGGRNNGNRWGRGGRNFGLRRSDAFNGDMRTNVDGNREVPRQRDEIIFNGEVDKRMERSDMNLCGKKRSDMKLRRHLGRKSLHFMLTLVKSRTWDLGGVDHTWEARGMKQRLGRIIFNQCWLNLLKSNKVNHGICRKSDHKPLIMASNLDSNGRKGSFFFQNMWIKYKSFEADVEANWKNPRHNGIKKLCEKMFRLEQMLKWWNKNVFGDLFKALKENEQNVMKAELDWQENPSHENLVELNKCSEDHSNKLSEEKACWKQRAHCRWMKDGERNTSLYHNMSNRRKLKKIINSI